MDSFLYFKQRSERIEDHHKKLVPAMHTEYFGTQRLPLQERMLI
jgi:hypothetical protein